jgi:uncharacterized membrane protein
VSRSAINVAVTIDAPPETVFAVLCDVERWPEWTPTMTSVQRLDQGPFGVGSSAQVRQPKLLPAVWKVTELEAQRNFTWVARTPGLRMKAGHLVERQGAGSRVQLSFELSGLMARVVSRLYGGLIEQYVNTESQKLKQRSESTATHALDPSR